MKNTAVLLISCPDQKGIVANVADFLYKNNANILHADEHKDPESNLFFLRTEWELDDFSVGKKDFSKKFLNIATKFKMNWKIKYSNEKLKTAILLSKEDHCLSDLLYRYKNNELFCDIPLIISNHQYAKSLAEFYKIVFYQVGVDSLDHETEIIELFKKYEVDFAILARYMKIFSSNFLKKFDKPIINIHHSFLPSFVGAKPYHQAFNRGVKVIGATAHYVTSDLDQGPIIEQDVLRVSHRDNVSDLVQKGKDLEKIVLSRAVKWHLDNRILVYKNKTVVFD